MITQSKCGLNYIPSSIQQESGIYKMNVKTVAE